MIPISITILPSKKIQFLSMFSNRTHSWQIPWPQYIPVGTFIDSSPDASADIIGIEVFVDLILLNINATIHE